MNEPEFIADAARPVMEAIHTLRERLGFHGVTMKVPNTVRKEFRKFQGQEVPVDGEARRSAVWLTPYEAALIGVEDASGLLGPDEESLDAPPGSRIAFANFWHDEQYWVAVVRPAEVQNVLAQQEIFLRSPIFKRPLAAHGQLRLIFREGAELSLYPQNEGQGAYLGEPVDDIVVSAEAVRPRIEGFPDFDLVGGARGWFRQSIRFMSTEFKVSKMLDSGHTVHQFLLHLKGPEPGRVFLEAIRRSHQIGLDLPYNLLAIGGTQCVFEMFNILDRSVVRHRPKPSFFIRLFRMMDRFPLMVGQYLHHRGLRYTEPAGVTFPTLNEETAMSEEQRHRLERKLETFGPVESGRK